MSKRMRMPNPRYVPCSVPVTLTCEQLKGVFKQHDVNGDGLLDKNELKMAFKSLGAVIPEWRAWRGLKNADANGDGVISEEELNILVNYAAELGYTVK